MQLSGINSPAPLTNVSKWENFKIPFIKCMNLDRHISSHILQDRKQRSFDLHTDIHRWNKLCNVKKIDLAEHGYALYNQISHHSDHNVNTLLCS